MAGGPPGLGGCIGEVGLARFNYDQMMKGMPRWKEIEENVEHDAVNSEKYIKELSTVCWEMIRATWAMFEQGHNRFINLFAAAGDGGASAGSFKCP
jgi:hypothetical protein